MSDPNSGPAPAPRRLRWWPAWLVLAAAVVAITVVRFRDDLTFQQRNLTTGAFLLSTVALLFLWWTLLSRARWRLRLGVTLA
ncbi:MAG: hypothetical protein WCP53_08935, partial [Verrucomicrobiota bacterium]